MTTTRRGKPRLADIAAIAGVSIATVSRVLDDHPAIRPETKARVREIAIEQGYPVRDRPAARPKRPLARRQSRHSGICIVLPFALPAGKPLASSFELNLLNGIGAAMRDRGLDFSVSSQAPHDSETLLKFVASHAYEGFIFLGQAQYHDGLNQLVDAGRPLVVWGVQTPDQRYCSIGGENVQGGHQATSHLIGLGRRRIVFIGEASPITSAQTGRSQMLERLNGFKNAHVDAGLEPGLSLVRPFLGGGRAGVEAVEGLLAQGIAFDGIVASSDLVALGAIEALRRHRLAVPGDVSIVGYDDIEFAGFVTPALTTVRQDPILAGHLLVGKILERMASLPIESERLPTQLVVRASCGAQGC